MSKTNDRALRFYNEVLNLDKLHYGMWMPEDEFSIEKLKAAQDRYEDYLINKIPSGVKTILDVGCGTGVMTKRLLGMEYDVEGLSPDKNQKKLFTEHLNAKFHHTTFDDFTPDKQFDCLIMSESAQYIHIEKLFRNTKHALNPQGYLMVCDYFILNQASGVLSKSGHNYDDFMKHARETGFTLVSENDITNDILKTLDFGKDIVEKVILAIQIGTESFTQKHPFITRLLMLPFRNKIETAKAEIQLLDSEKFRQNKTYRFLLFQLS